MLKRLKHIQQTLWSIDALLFVMAYTVLLLLIPTPSPRWRQHASDGDVVRDLADAGHSDSR